MAYRVCHPWLNNMEIHVKHQFDTKEIFYFSLILTDHSAVHETNAVQVLPYMYMC